MKKIFLIAMMACAVFGTMTSCSDDYEDASKPHVYSETENPPVKGSDANMVTSPLKMKQANAGSEVKTIDLSDITKFSVKANMSSLECHLTRLSQDWTMVLLDSCL